jgi:NAD(P)H-dependent nitrite reductase large subunit/NAD(P)H-dependent nitrite reductase small subunit
VDIIVVSCGVRPRDELARGCGLELGGRGGVKVDANLRSSDENIYAIGEVAAIGGSLCYGLWAPGVEQADALVKNLVDGAGTVEYKGSDLSTKLKLLGVDVASFGRTLDFWFKRQFDGKDPEIKSLECSDEVNGTYRRLCFSKDGSQLMGGILVGDAKDYSKLLQLSKKPDLAGNDHAGLLSGRPAAGAASGKSLDGGDGTGLADDDLICTCIGLTKATVRAAIKDKDAHTVPLIKKACKAGTGCGGCVAPVGEVPKLLAHTLKTLGKFAATGICEHFPYTRKELFLIIKLKKLKSVDDIMNAACHGMGGCEHCKPVIASILASLWNEHCLQDGRDQLQDTNDRFLANIQKTGTYSIIPRCAGGDITPDTLLAFANTAKKYGLWTKITGAQRMGMYGAERHHLPAIFKELTEAGMESGQAYGKALRAVKSCVGTDWCRYGQQDSVKMAVTIENRYKGIRSPHKLKMAVSGCLRECAEAQGKDVGVIATKAGYNLYFGGNGGAKPVHAKLFATDLDETRLLKYIDRYLMFYISTAKHLERTAPWQAGLEGGIEFLQKVIIEDSLNICADLDEMMEQNKKNYHCEWKAVAYDEELQKKFQQFVNTKETHDSEQVEYINARGQRHPNTYSPPDITGPALYSKETAPSDWEWIFAGKVSEYPCNGGLAVKHGDNELAIFHMPKQSSELQWLATQNICPHRQARTISRGLVGELSSGAITVADPIYKMTFDLRTGNGIANPNLNLSTFQVKVDGDQVLVRVPPHEEMKQAFDEQIQKAYDAAGMENLKAKAPPKPSLDW